MRAVDPETDSVLITGSTGGIGKHAALVLNARGFTVFAGVRKMAQGEELKALAKFPDKYIPVLLDVTDTEQIHEACSLVGEHVGENGLTGLLHVAGVQPGLQEFENGEKSLSMEASSMDVYRWVMEVEYFGAVELTKACLPLLEQHGDGRIVFNSDDKISAQ